MDPRCWMVTVQWGSEYQPYAHTKHLNTKLFEGRISNGSLFTWLVYFFCWLVGTHIEEYLGNLTIFLSKHLYQLQPNQLFLQLCFLTTFWGPQMVGLCAMSLALDRPFQTRPVHKKTRWHPFVNYSNSWAFWYFNSIQIPDHLASNLFSTIWTQTRWYSDPHCICEAS